MKFWERVHWFFTSKCNQQCRFCFKPDFDSSSSESQLILSRLLADNHIKEVIFTGGEPLLSNSLEASLEILSKAGIYTSIHTNANLLNPKRLSDLVALTDDIAIPLDSTDREVQAYLRKSDCLPQIENVLSQLQAYDIKIGIHTVATSVNISHVPQIYESINKGRFDYWRIYEFNPEIVSDKFNSAARFREVQKLSKRSLTGRNIDYSDGGVNCLFADFLLMEETMSKHKDKRIQFVGISDYDRTPYFFLDSKGDVYLAVWFSQGIKPIGNLLLEGYKKVKGKAIKEYAEGPLYDEDAYIETIEDQPLWVRTVWEGNYHNKELDDVKPRYHKKFEHLSELCLNRMKKQGKVPKDTELTHFF